MSQRWTPDKDQFVLNYNATGDQTIQLPAFELAPHRETVVEHIREQVQSATGDAVSCTYSGNELVLYSTGANFTVTWSKPALRDALGFSGNLSGDDTYRTSYPGTLTLTNALQDVLPSVVYSTLKNDRRSSLFFAKSRRFAFTVRAMASELDALRSVIAEGIKGIPLSVFFDSGDAAAWSWSNFDGRILCLVKSAQYTDTWLTAPHQRVVDISLEVEQIE